MELIRLEYASFRDFARELSPRMTRDGLWLASERPAPLGAEVAFEIDLADGFRLLRGRGEVTAALAEGPPAARGMAIAFRELDAASRHLVDKIVARHRASGGSVLVLPGVASEPAEREGATEDAGSPAAQWLPPKEEERLIGELMVAELEEMLASEEQVEEQGTEGIHEQEQETKDQVRERVGEPVAAPRFVRTQDTLEPPPATSEPVRLTEPRRFAIGSRRPGSLVRWAAALVALAGVGWILAQVPWGGGGRPALPSDALGSAAAAPSTSDPPPAVVPGPESEPSLTRVVTVPRPESEPSFTRVVTVSAARQGDTTVITLVLDGAAAPGRWALERLSGGRPREVVRLFGVASLPQPARLELADPLVARLRGGLHSGPRGAELHLVADLADPRARLAGVEAGERSLRLVFLRD